MMRPQVARDLPAEFAGPRQAILAHAMLAPSSHNTQSWRVHVESDRRWIVGPDPARQLRAVDTEARELVLSVGTFLEYLCVAAAAFGLATEVEPITDSRIESGMATVTFQRAPPSGGSELERIRNRRTLRNGYRSDSIRADDLEALRSALGEDSAWYERESREGTWLAGATRAAFAQQAWRDDAQTELAAWFRFSADEVRTHRDGLTLAAMQVGGIEGFFAEHFMTAKSVMGKSFREHGIAATATQVANCAGWMVITSLDASVPQLLDAGRRYARMALLLRERGLAAAPMSQTMEEPPWRAQLAPELALRGSPQFVLRVGYVDDYPPPVSPRREPESILVQ